MRDDEIDDWRKGIDHDADPEASPTPPSSIYSGSSGSFGSWSSVSDEASERAESEKAEIERADDDVSDMDL